MKSLAGKRIIVTRALEQADELVVPLQKLGAEVVLLPTIEIAPPDSWEFCDAAIDNLSEYGWIIFSSTNGVRFFVNRLRARGHQTSEVATAQIAAVGERTKAALEEVGIRVDLVPDEFRAEGVLKAFAEIDLHEKRILVSKAQESRNVLINELHAMGAVVDAVPVYKNQRPAQINVSEFTATLNGQSVDVLTFSSPSTVRNFVEMLGRDKIEGWLKDGCKIAAIGGVTAEALHELELPVDILPAKSTIPNLVEAIADFFS